MKYVVLITNNPYGWDDGFVTHCASSVVLGNKYYGTKEEAEYAAEEWRKKYSHEEIKKQFHIMEDVFIEMRRFIMNSGFIHVNSISIENKLSKNELIQLFIKMYGLTIEYNEEMFEEDEKTFQKLFHDEPVVTLVEIES